MNPVSGRAAPHATSFRRPSIDGACVTIVAATVLAPAEAPAPACAGACAVNKVGANRANAYKSGFIMRREELLIRITDREAIQCARQCAPHQARRRRAAPDGKASARPRPP